jgi:hypothetical protein
MKSKTMSETKDTHKSATDQDTDASNNQGIDIEQLAEKVYQLLCEEIRQDRARGDARRQRR